jgi:formate/nitrite transporter FocA (FNT family)
MTVSFIGATSAEATSLTLPTHQAGDLLVMLFLRAANSGVTVPSGWAVSEQQTATGGGSRAIGVAYRIATAAGTATGTFTNANMLTAAVFRDDVNYIVIGGVAFTGSSTATVNYAALSSKNTINTSLKVIGDSSVLMLYGAALTNGTTMQQTPSNCTTQHNAVLATYEAVLHTTNAAVASRTASSITADVSVVTSTYVAEIYDTGVAKTSGGGYRPVNIRGGADQ